MKQRLVFWKAMKLEILSNARHKNLNLIIIDIGPRCFWSRITSVFNFLLDVDNVIKINMIS